jgi:hypothetical protein
MEVFQCQLINIITQKKEIYRLLYSVLYLCIILIFGIYIYWDTIYKTAKKNSKCNNISKIIDENYYNEIPFVYTIIILNTKMIKKPKEYIIKITYDFNKMETKIEYGIEYVESKSKDDVFIYNISDYIAINDKIKELKIKKDSYYKLLKETNRKDDLSQYNKIAVEYSTLINSEKGIKTLELNNKPNFINSFKYNYYDLKKMSSDIINDISLQINSNDYKYFAVNNNFKIINSYTTNELIKFTKEYSKNKNYPITIIDYIIFSKLQQKNFNNI